MERATLKLRGAAQRHAAAVDTARRAVEWNGAWVPVSQLSLDVPVSGTVYGTLLNYQGALAALGGAVHEPPYQEPPKAPILYIKPANTHIACGMPIPCPHGVDALEMGAALGIVMGRPATRVPPSEALSYVHGYTIVNDVSIPHASYYRPAIREKARDGFCPIGPWVVHREAVPNPDDVGIRVYVNRELRQENTTRNLIRAVPQLIADVTEFMTLSAGDVLLVGVPEGAPLAAVGDTVRIEIDHIGALQNAIVPEQAQAMGVRA
ncbi:fumarylacetoacetate hydrolase family protein [Alicyclobacillus cycloheptanicus]|jgi:5-oxopent-3-ene-1,2,5-tricarboxylate decarboxylase/2-hydroxyhepta-2,4-diene-1,7-dioate isomerase|uniref:5-oxopent-3-ene-1,2,5-tricarboxylate decarboxylase/2-hydroxyhepta-2,4-diene-1,7-dioate isomerase n=1 Tax=Alicyclobacillus cycloheptanicus TaxID=1457 RepID=A0ABT9XFQ9_9BACL|nr:fumarylacetoacetate hydrolase family protein [Alicyclobacillus cycloheptanicus]MDQ0189133.1 5-oxopent-3-ene-1,2,5-tricarboxylate decarboxylase/2-hydroxyhepta-2,4-diene-1,7-dioate isomerase [Alicyclobacillus cycloheptanicus]WDM00260.1 fumarylacetoacetate hydrolase family protein [Alicyclobacillus cycloheptanicus]